LAFCSGSSALLEKDYLERTDTCMTSSFETDNDAIIYAIEKVISYTLDIQ
jgi:hypothetical protein